MVKSGQLIDAPVTWRSHGPVLPTVMVSVELLPAHTLPKLPAPLVVILPGGAVPVIITPMDGLTGSFPLTVMVALFWVRLELVGEKRIGAVSEFPPSMVIGNGCDNAEKNSAESVDPMLFTVSGHLLLSEIVSGKSAKDPTHTLPKLLLPATPMTGAGALQVAFRVIVARFDDDIGTGCRLATGRNVFRHWIATVVSFVRRRAAGSRGR